MPSSHEKNTFVPPQSLHCLSFPAPDWREQVRSTAPPEKQFRDMAWLRMTRAFDPHFYWTENPDVRRDQRDPFEHYLYHGATENRRPHPNFHPAFYRRQTGLSPETNPLLHYLLHPEAEFLKPNPAWKEDRPNLPWVHPFEYQGLSDNLQPESPVLFDFQTPAFHFDKGRYLLCLGLAVLEAGHPLLLSVENLARLPSNARELLLQQPGVHQVPGPQSLSGDEIQLGDGGKRSNTFPVNRRIQVLLESRASQKLQLPYPMHSSVLRSRAHRFLHTARERKRTIAILFAGQNPWRYRFTPMAKSYGLINRHHVLKTAREFLKDQCDDQIDHDRLIQERSPQAPPAVFIDSRKWRIIPQCWLDRLGYARFFLCPPGAVHPLSHNLVEAMAVGTVPILEYGQLLNPPLVDGENSLLFRGRRGLREKLENALHMPEDQWEKLHRGAIRYFEKNLNFPRAVRMILDPHSEADAVSLPFKS